VPEERISVRPAVVDDVPVILQFIRGLAEFEHMSDEVVQTEAALREHLFGPRPYCEALIAEVTGEPVGYALFYTTYSTFQGKPGLFLEDLFVVPERRGRGAGKALMIRLAETADKRGCCNVDWQVLNWNERALRFYQQLGAGPVEEWTTYRLEGAALDRLAQASPGMRY
jgi:GNAT superfamily N-acetyltransferase